MTKFSLTLILSLCTLTTAHALQGAAESRFFINRKPDQNHFEASLSQSKQKYNFAHFNEQGYYSDPQNNVEFDNTTTDFEVQKTALNLNYSRMLTDSIEFNAGTVLSSKKLSYSVYSWDAQQNSYSSESTGFEVLNLGVKKSIPHDSYTMNYGATAEISPGARIEARDSKDQSWQGRQESGRGNNFQGYHRLAAFLGSESYVDSLAISTAAVLSQSVSASTSNDTVLDEDHKAVLGAKFALEFPMISTLNMGIAATVGQAISSLDLSKLFEQERSTSIYTNYTIDKQTQLNLEYSNQELLYPYELSENKVTLGLSKTL